MQLPAQEKTKARKIRKMEKQKKREINLPSEVGLWGSSGIPLRQRPSLSGIPLGCFKPMMMWLVQALKIPKAIKLSRSAQFQNPGLITDFEGSHFQNSEQMSKLWRKTMQFWDSCGLPMGNLKFHCSPQIPGKSKNPKFVHGFVHGPTGSYMARLS